MAVAGNLKIKIFSKQTRFNFSKNAGNVEDQLTKWRLHRRNSSNSPIRLDPIKKQNVSKVSEESKNDQESQNQAKIEEDEGETFYVF